MEPTLILLRGEVWVVGDDSVRPYPCMTDNARDLCETRLQLRRKGRSACVHVPETAPVHVRDLRMMAKLLQN